MKKVIYAIIAIIVVGGGFWGYRMWANDYSKTTAYAVVPEKVPAKEIAKDDDGKTITGQSTYKYTLDFVTDKGEKRTIKYQVLGNDPQPLTPGAYIEAQISKTRINEGPKTVSADKVPDTVKAKLK